MKRDLVIHDIQRIMDKIPDDVLLEIYDVLKAFENKKETSIPLLHNLNKILSEDKGLLERLAK